MQLQDFIFSQHELPMLFADDGGFIQIPHSRVLLMSGSAAMAVQCEQDEAKHTALRSPVLSTNGEEVWLPI